MAESKPYSKFLLTVEIDEDRNPEQVESVLLMAADKLKGRLTRSDLVPSDADGYYRRVRSKTLRKLG